VFELKGIEKRYGELVVYDGVDLLIERGQKVALVGPNGAGKSTLMKLMTRIEPLSGGEIVTGDKVVAGYFAQNLAESLNYNNSVLKELNDDAQGMTTPEIRGLLGALLFSGDEVEKRAGVLSGGERARLALAKVLARRNNCLLLDEPTNNLDIIAKDTLLEALRRFPGTVLIVSHDRHVLNELVTEVIEVGQGHAIRYLGNYDDYLAKKAEMEARAAAASNGAFAPKPAPAPVKREAQPNRDQEREQKRRSDRAAKERSRIEADIEKKETERAALATEMNDPNFYLARKDADQLIARYERLGREVEKLYGELEKYEQQPAN
jgi:ATP-binding cassette subfamily F protein 3